MNIENIPLGTIIEFLYPITNRPESGTYGTGKLVKIIHRRTGGQGGQPTDIIVENNLGDQTRIRENNIRWDRTEYHMEKKVDEAWKRFQ